ncbi:N-acetyltransferase [Lichenibacterium minor]|uniref:N-acetyltransferase n=1 Tax=Lichenibacterium minor TaxID=2316528 RepID=A0A4Q2U7M5_9HYPH|nr:GNAT family protein [Lichenibacterium minor]RYC32699.1 N-acetyltransferase [Lichenibacterium minor]
MTETRPTDRPKGPPVDPAPAPRPERKVLDGRFVRLEPLDAARHGPALWRSVAGADAVWDYLFDGPYADEAGLAADLAAKAASSDPLFWAIVDAASGHAVGYAALMRQEPAHRAIEVGNVLFTPALQRRPAATEAMALLAGYVFDGLGYRRYEWKCNALNAPSRAAAERLGFTFEGVFRQHMIVKGRSRDTAWYAMTDRDWPAARRAFDLWLAPDNFDENGRQRRGLAALRTPAP